MTKTTRRFLVCQGLKTPNTVASFLYVSFEVLPLTDDASVVNGKTSKKSVQKRRGGFRCVMTLKALTHQKPPRRFLILSSFWSFTVYDARVVGKR